MMLRPLGRSGLDVSTLCLGGNVFGWTADEPTSFAILDRYVVREILPPIGLAATIEYYRLLINVQSDLPGQDPRVQLAMIDGRNELVSDDKNRVAVTELGIASLCVLVGGFADEQDPILGVIPACVHKDLRSSALLQR